MEQKKLYETMFLIDNSLGEEAVKALVEKFTSLIAANAETESVNEWGVRRLAYPINYKNEGYYVLVNYKSEPTFPLELERVLGITDGIIRSMTTRANGTVVAAPAVAASAPAVEVVEATEAVSEAAEEAAE
jgi:small subunit ribosomal protein S6